MANPKPIEQQPGQREVNIQLSPMCKKKAMIVARGHQRSAKVMAEPDNTHEAGGSFVAKTLHTYIYI